MEIGALTGIFFLYRSPYEGRLFCNRHGQQGTWGICDENGGIKSSCIKNRPLTGKGKKKMDRGCGYGGRCSPSVRSSENRKGSDPGIFRGANTALEFAADHPERAEKIIAVSANALPDGLIPPMLFMENTRFQCAKILENIKPSGKNLEKLV